MYNRHLVIRVWLMGLANMEWVLQIKMRNSPGQKQTQKIANNVPLSYFKKQNIHILKRNQSYLSVLLDSNRLLLALGLLYLRRILKGPNLSLFQKQVQDISINLKDVPQPFQPCNHQQTIKAILHEVSSKLSRQNNWQQWVKTVNQYPVFSFCFMAYLRAKGRIELESRRSRYQDQLMGNEIQLLESYNSELRNVPLSAIANSLQVKMEIDWTHSIEIVGEGAEVLRMEMGQECRFHIGMEPYKTLLSQTSNSSWNSKQIREQRLDKSVNSSVSKLGKLCVKCGKVKTTKFCECRKSTPSRQSIKPSNQIPPRQLQPVQFYLNYRNRQKQN